MRCCISKLLFRLNLKDQTERIYSTDPWLKVLINDYLEDTQYIINQRGKGIRKPLSSCK